VTKIIGSGLLGLVGVAKLKQPHHLVNKQT